MNLEPDIPTDHDKTVCQSCGSNCGCDEAIALLAAASRIQSLAAKGKCEGVEIEGWEPPSDVDWTRWNKCPRCGDAGPTPSVNATPYDTAAIAWCLEEWYAKQYQTPTELLYFDGIWHVTVEDELEAGGLAFTRIEALLAALDAELARLEGE